MKKINKYELAVRASEKVSWKIDDVLPDNVKLSFEKPYLPFIVNDKSWNIDEIQKLDLNHIISNSYLNLFAFVEEYIISLMVNICSEKVNVDNTRLRALLRFSDEEVKHQMLFRKFCQMFSESFKVAPQVLSEAREVADVILNNSLPAVLLVTYHLELITQKHFLLIKEKEAHLDPLFFKMLKLHWLEETQHAMIDEMELIDEAKKLDEGELAQALSSYIGITEAFRGLLLKQAEFDVEALTKIHPTINSNIKVDLTKKVHAIYRDLFITSGFEHKSLIKLIHEYFPKAAPIFEKEKLKSAA